MSGSAEVPVVSADGCPSARLERAPQLLATRGPGLRLLHTAACGSEKQVNDGPGPPPAALPRTRVAGLAGSNYLDSVRPPDAADGQLPTSPCTRPWTTPPCEPSSPGCPPGLVQAKYWFRTRLNPEHDQGIRTTTARKAAMSARLRAAPFAMPSEPGQAPGAGAEAGRRVE